MGKGLSERRMWFNTKYDQSMMLWMQQDVDVGKLIKGNEQFAYIYVAGRKGPIRKKVEVREVVTVGNLDGGAALV